MEDDRIETFFRDMKAADEHRPVPPFPERKEPRKLRPVLLYAAAAAIAAILITMRYLATPTDAQATIEIEISVAQEPSNRPSLLETNEQDLSTWKSPTDFLSESY